MAYLLNLGICKRVFKLFAISRPNSMHSCPLLCLLLLATQLGSVQGFIQPRLIMTKHPHLPARALERSPLRCMSPRNANRRMPTVEKWITREKQQSAWIGETASGNYLRCMGCYTCYDYEPNVEQRDVYPFRCAVCHRQFVVSPNTVGQLPARAALVDATDEDTRFMRTYMKQYRGLPSPLMVYPRRLVVSNVPYGWTIYDVGELFAEYGLTDVRCTPHTKLFFVEIATKEGFEQALEEMSKFFVGPGLRLVVKPAFDKNIQRTFVQMRKQNGNTRGGGGDHGGGAGDGERGGGRRFYNKH